MTTWREFKQDTERQFRKQLQEYRRRVTQWWAIDSNALPEQAIWTVLWQQGKSPGQIRIWEAKRHRSLNEPTIHMGCVGSLPLSG